MIFHDGFESGDLRRWDDQDGNRAPEHRVVEDPAQAHAGRGFVTLTQQPGGAIADLVKWLGEGHDQVHVRYYVRFAAEPVAGIRHDGPGANQNGGSLAGLRDRWLLGSSSTRPDGRDLFVSQVLVDDDWGRNPAPGDLKLRAQHPGMRPAAGGSPWWGEVRAPAQPFRPVPGRWHCVELMLAANTPGQADGEQALWFDGELVIRSAGLRWREDASLRINVFWLPFALRDCPRPTSLGIDDVVIATSYIGPMAARGSGADPPR